MRAHHTGLARCFLQNALLYRRIWYLLPLESWRILLLTVKKLLIAPGGPYRRLPLAATASTRQASPCISGMVASARRSPLGGALQAS